ncbi:hypothetical protein EB796_013471 [Bugula neritina]|uniref:RHD domain-containing protein n=1 Tax=Bugula neritina TaxID=10212 RepID=A0A7J7JQK5_BUGNE|nr:hypothetical protein EB796_013471 [Bugula neritina]
MYSGSHQVLLYNNFDIYPILPEMPQVLSEEHGKLVVETQPIPSLRYRYKSEAGRANITGAGDKPWPAVKVIGYQGKATLIASLVSVPESSDENPKPHPHRLEGQNAENGVVVKKDLEITSENNIIPLDRVYLVASKNNAKNRDWQPQLDNRKKLKVDPYRNADNNPLNKIDRNYVQICFQLAILKNGKCQLLQPVCSDPIHNSTCKASLSIVKMTPTHGPASGTKQMIMLINGVTRKGDIKKIRFYDEATSWEAEGRFKEKDIHECAAIQLVYPEYKPLSDKHLLKQRNVNVQLVTERGASNTLKFTYFPVEGGGQSKKERRMLSTPAAEHSAAADVPLVVHDSSSGIYFSNSLAK